MSYHACCDRNVQRDKNVHGCIDGDTYTCPTCDREWTHVCDEAEGCFWVQPERSDTPTTETEA